MDLMFRGGREEERKEGGKEGTERKKRRKEKHQSGQNILREVKCSMR